MSAWQKHDVPENCFLLPCEVFQLGLTRGVLLVYLYLIYRKYLKHSADRLSCADIGRSVGLCAKTVRTHLQTLVTNGLIEMEGDGGKFSYTLCPIQDKVQERCTGRLSA